MTSKSILTAFIIPFLLLLSSCKNKQEKILLGQNNEVTEPLVEEEESISILEVAVDNLKLRDKPDVSSKTLVLLPIGTKVSYDGKKSDTKSKVVLNDTEINEYWYYVTTAENNAGWVHGCCIFNPTQPNLPGILSASSQRLLRANDISGYDYDKLERTRDEIYARHGFIFQNESVNNYFKKQEWYKPTANNVDSKLSDIEKYNLKFLEFEMLQMEMEGEAESDMFEYEGILLDSSDSNSEYFNIEFDGSYYKVPRADWEAYKKEQNGKHEEDLVKTLAIRTALERDRNQLNKIANTFFNVIHEVIQREGITMKTVSQIQNFDIIRTGTVQFK